MTVDPKFLTEPPDGPTAACVIHARPSRETEAAVIDLAGAAANAGLHLVVITLIDRRGRKGLTDSVLTRLRTFGATVRELRIGSCNPLGAVTLAKLLRDETVDVVHTLGKRTDVLGRVAAKLARVPSVSSLPDLSTATEMEPQRLRAVPASHPRRIAFVEFPPAGGLFQFSLQLGEALARCGDDVELITGPSPELSSREPGCRVHSILPTWHPTAGADAPELWRRMRRVLRAAQYTVAWGVLARHLRRTRPDVVMWSAWRFPIDGVGVHLIRTMLPNSVLGMVVHEARPLVEQPGHDGLYKDSLLTDRSLAIAFTDLDVAFVLGESSKQVLIETRPITAPIHVIPHGDEGVFAREPIPGAAETGPSALTFGNITAYKGIDILCEAWPMVRERVPDAELVIAGSLSADIDKAAFQAQVAQLPGVTLHASYVAVEDVAPFFARARCVVLPYRRSSQSGVAHLAYTFSRPVVSTRVGDIPAVVQDGISGLLVSPSAPEELADAVVRLLTDPEMAERMGKSGAEAMASGASWDEIAQRVRAAISTVTPRSSQQRPGD